MFEYEGISALEQIERAALNVTVLIVKERLLRAAAALETAHVPCAMIGGNAVGAWIEQVQEAVAESAQESTKPLRHPQREGLMEFH